MTDHHGPHRPEDAKPDDMVEDGVAQETAEQQEDEHVVPEGADEDVRLADSWVKDDGAVEEAQAEQREAGGFR